MNKFFSPYPVALMGGLAIIRILVGLLMTYHGWEIFDAAIMKEYTTWDAFKKFPSPTLFVYIGKATELMAGMMLTVGLFTRIAALALVFTMIYITFFIGNGRFWYEDQHPFLFVLLGMVFAFSGPGKWSVDQWRLAREQT
ncbi:MAG TPA: DoxX family protein, partial [Agriterribacter sp.]|nr:DoxX family protein [Agriterribacter sp.]